MISYTATKRQFISDVKNGCISNILQKAFSKNNVSTQNNSEYVSWENSLPALAEVLDCEQIDDCIQVAIEYQIPLTAKRVDFMLVGMDEFNREQIMLIELKQWSEAGRTSRNGIVTAFTGGMVRSVVHPSYQVYTYMKMIEEFTAAVQNDNIQLHSCVYLHNYKKSKLDQLKGPHNESLIEEIPIFIKEDTDEMRRHIVNYISKPANRNLIEIIDNSEIKPSKSLQDTLSSLLDGNDEFIMVDEQKVVFETVLKLVELSKIQQKKYTVIIEGGPGTGKSVVAIQLLVKLNNLPNTTVHYVTKNAAPRNVYFAKLRKGQYKLNYIKTLFKSSGTYYNCNKNQFDCLVVDEAHRLNMKSGFKSNLGENQVKEIVNSARVSVFFIDEDQIVTSKDIGTIDEIKKWANELGSEVYSPEETRLHSQFRCNGSDGYIAFLDRLLEIRDTANDDGYGLTYDLQVFDDPSVMREALRIKNLINNKARMVAGYCYEWDSRNSNDLIVYDIDMDNGFRARWNFSNTDTWAIDEDSFDQVGCIHTSQGLEFDYVGVIIGLDMRFENGSIITDPLKRANSDYSLSGIKKAGNIKADRIIRNTYRTLMTRGLKGCYIFCEDRALGEHLKTCLSNMKMREKSIF